jgi:hypothetical protein
VKDDSQARVALDVLHNFGDLNFYSMKGGGHQCPQGVRSKREILILLIAEVVVRLLKIGTIEVGSGPGNVCRQMNGKARFKHRIALQGPGNVSFGMHCGERVPA